MYQECLLCGSEWFQEYSEERCFQEGVRINEKGEKDYDKAGTIVVTGSKSKFICLTCETCGTDYTIEKMEKY